MNERDIRAGFPAGLAHTPLPPAAHRLAAVLVPLEAEHGVWLTRRGALLPQHAGQVAFPGGAIEPGDISVEAAALREAQEEVGLRREDAEVLGRMDDFVTGTGFHISPVVALIASPARFVAAAGEVEEVFCLPFEVVLDRRGPRRREAVFHGRSRAFWVWPHDQHVIWGATAAILRDLAGRLRGRA